MPVLKITICLGFIFVGGLSAARDLSKVVDTSIIDQRVSPCDDFFQYSCGGWLQKTEIPSDRTRFYRFTEIDERTENLLRDLLDGYRVGHNDPPQKFASKMGAFYQSCMDEKQSELAGQRGVDELLKTLKSAKASVGLFPNAEWARTLAQLHRQGIPAFFNFVVDQDPGDATQVIPQFDQGGIGLPEKGYYLDDTDDSAEIRKRYQKHIQKMLLVSKITMRLEAETVQRIFDLETELAKASLSPVDRRDPKAIYHKMTLKDLQVLAPQFHWIAYFNELNIPIHSALNVAVPAFFKAFGFLLEHRSSVVLDSYLQWQILHAVAESATPNLKAEHFAFYDQFLNGQKEPLPRWKECVYSVDHHLGEALGEAFVARTYGPEAHALAVSMMEQIQGEVGRMFDSLDWMDSATRVGALKKLKTLVKKVGYPKPSRDYEAFRVVTDSWFKNVLEGRQFEFNRRLQKIGKPVDRSEWSMTASTNNAYYNPSLNEIVFPAGILQEPLFNVNADLAANYGATGATIGHEITHGFDDEGRMYDENGSMRDWWSEESTQRFGAKAQCLVKQYDQYKVADGVSVQGALTLGENIADLGGLKIALNAFQRAASATPGAQDYQRFFIAYAQSWCGKATPEYEKNSVQIDPHAPVRFRVNGVVVNMREFSEAFRCQEGQPLRPAQRCEVW